MDTSGINEKGAVALKKERTNSKGTNIEYNLNDHVEVVEKNAATNYQQVTSKRLLTDQYEVLDDDTKRRKLTGDERLKRNRERNRIHARKTRERKKKQSFALQQRISELKVESNLLRQMIDERFTACALLGLSQQTNQDGESIPILSSATVCKKSSLDFTSSDIADMNVDIASPIRRARRRGKYSPQERERIRRERNRMHAKRTRDKKKLILEASEQTIYKMENESKLLREYLVSVKLISAEEAAQSDQRTIQSKKELALLKAYSLQLDGNDGEEDDEDDDDEEDDDDQNQDHEQVNVDSNYDDNDDGDDEQGYHSGSDEKGSWGGSNDGSNQESLNGETSGDGDNSGSDKGRRSTSTSSNASSTSLQFDRVQSNLSTSREGSTGSENGNSGDNGSYNGNSGDNGSGTNSGDDSEKYSNTTPNEQGR